MLIDCEVVLWGEARPVCRRCTVVSRVLMLWHVGDVIKGFLCFLTRSFSHCQLGWHRSDQWPQRSPALLLCIIAKTFVWGFFVCRGWLPEKLAKAPRHVGRSPPSSDRSNILRSLLAAARKQARRSTLNCLWRPNSKSAASITLSCIKHIHYGHHHQNTPARTVHPLQTDSTAPAIDLRCGSVFPLVFADYIFGRCYCNGRCWSWYAQVTVAESANRTSTSASVEDQGDTTTWCYIRSCKSIHKQINWSDTTVVSAANAANPPTTLSAIATHSNI